MSHQSHQRLTSRPLSPPPLQSNGSIDTSSSRRLPYGLTEDLLHGFYSDDGIDETLPPGAVTSALDRSLSGSRRIKFMDSNIPEELMDYDHNPNVNGSLPPTSADGLPPHVIDIRKALVDGDAPAAVVSYVVKAVNTYEFWIRDLWKVANAATPSTAADVTEREDGCVMNHNIKSTLIKRHPSTRDTLTNSKRSIARSSSIQHSLNQLPNGGSVADVLSRMEGKVNILRERIGSKNGESVDVLLRDCQHDLAALRKLTLEVIKREAPRYQTFQPAYQQPPNYPATNATPNPQPSINVVCSSKTATNVPYSPKTATTVARSPKTATTVLRSPKTATTVRSLKTASQSTVRSPAPYAFLGKPPVPADVFRVSNNSHPNGVAVYQSRTASTLEIPPIFMKPQQRRSMWCCSTTM